MQADLREHQLREARIEQLIEAVEAFPDPQARATTQELVEVLLNMFGEGLARMLALTDEAGEPGQALLGRFVDDEMLAALFMLFGLHPIPLATRIQEALASVRPYLKSHGGGVEFLRVEGSTAYLRLIGSCNGCPSSTMTLKSAIEEAIFKVAPDLDDLRVEGVTPPPQPVTFIPRRKPSAQPSAADDGWQVVTGLTTLTLNRVKAIKVEGDSLLFCRVADTYYAYRNQCAGCQASLAKSRLEGTTLTCATCARSYDICRAGRCLDEPTLYLEPVPLLVTDGEVKVKHGHLVTA